MQILGAYYQYQHAPDFVVDWSHGFWLRAHVVILCETPAYFLFQGKPMLVRENEMVILEEGVPQYFYGSGVTWLHHWMYVWPEEADAALWGQWDFPLNTIIRVEDPLILSRMIRDVQYKINIGGACQQPILDQYARLFFWNLYEMTSHGRIPQADETRPASPSHRSALLQLRKQLYTQPAEALSPEEAAASLYISRSWFDMQYKTCFGHSYQTDVIHARIQQARHLLLNSDLKMQEVAEACGYRNVEHFGRQFRRAIGIAPGQYRRHPQ